ncbi:FecR family protein [Parabacteroides faecis]|uniref:FecR family protein n=1 Tax=Parabacteroides faecis TaxID=1217282 RepID=UPI003521447E
MSEKNSIETLIVRYLKQEIDEHELRILDAWLEESPENKSYFFQLKNVSDEAIYLSFTPESVGEESWQKMKKRMFPEKTEIILSKKQFFKNDLFFSYFKYSAIILLTLSIGWGISEFRYHSQNLSSNTKEVVYNEISVQKGGRANTLMLSDGSKVVLNAATKFWYPANFATDTRTVYLEGEAYFEVTKDVKRPFIVKVKRQDITVLGTTFNVEAYKDFPFSVVTLLSGSVALKAFDDKGKVISHMLLRPNQKAFFDNYSGSLSVENVNAALVTSWVRGEFKFKDAPLIAIITHLEHYYNVRIHLDDQRLGCIKYTGTFSLDQNIEEVLKIIDYEKAFIFKKIGKDIYISRN